MGVYTCQKPRSEQCGFFLWKDDAAMREKRAVLEGQGSESPSPVKKNMDINTPLTKTGGLPTPRTSERAWPTAPAAAGRRTMSDPFATPTKKGGSLAMKQSHSQSSGGMFSDGEEDDDDEEDFGWDNDLDEEIGKLTQQEVPVSTPTPRLPPPETPRKVPRTDTLTSPGKRKFDDMQRDGEGEDSQGSFRILDSGPSDPFTPRTSGHRQLDFSSLYTPQTDSLKTISSVGQATPTPTRFSSQDLLTPGINTRASSQSLSSSSPHCPLATQALTLLDAHKSPLTQAARDDLLSLLARNDVKTQGILRGREVTRLKLQKTEESVKDLTAENRELLAKVEDLEAQREMDKATIAGFMIERRRRS
ncbi:hypothetical protein FQN54_003086 [Arachnomyces sp. PD_36]|nr:hypothetical protein FQN54_003086 [Arachnomyces sp. PD_36]